MKWVMSAACSCWSRTAPKAGISQPLRDRPVGRGHEVAARCGPDQIGEGHARLFSRASERGPFLLALLLFGDGVLDVPQIQYQCVPFSLPRRTIEPFISHVLFSLRGPCPRHPSSAMNSRSARRICSDGAIPSRACNLSIAVCRSEPGRKVTVRVAGDGHPASVAHV